MRRSKNIFKIILVFTCLVYPYKLMLAQSAIEEKIGESTYMSVERTMGFYHNPAVLDYVKSVGAKLESQITDYPYDFQYFLVDTDEPNAFATAGGYVFVTRGILPIIDTEDELAGVLGHEFAHVILKHSTKKMYRNIIPMVLEIPGNLLGEVYPHIVGELINLPIEITTMTTDAAFSRRQEKQADKHGIRIASGAGYDPGGLRSALLKLEEYIEDRYDMQEHFSLFLDHPLTEDRAKNLENLQKKYGLEAKALTPVLDHMDGVILGQDPAQGLLQRDHTFVHPDLDLYLKLPPDWRIDNTPEALNAADKSGYTGFIMGVAGNITELESAAAEIAERVDAEQYQTIIGKPYSLNGYKAIDVVIAGKDLARQGKSRMTFIRLDHANITLKCFGTAHHPDQYREIEEIIASLRPLTQEEKQQVTFQVLHIAEGSDETLEEFLSKRGPEVAENKEISRILNRMELSESVKDKQVKYVRTQQYFLN